MGHGSERSSTAISLLARFVGAASASILLAACSSSSSRAGAEGDAGATYPASASSTDCKASVTQGAVNGARVGGTCEYKGIPYAQPPVGSLRFMPPQPAGPFATSPMDATSFGAYCPQSSVPGVSIATSEDCLFLNVYTPQTAPAQPLPVMVFIHGGAFNSGSGAQYDGQPLSEKGPVVLVTLNYRLGALGFLALPELDAMRGGRPSGSDGIRDQQLALHWVHDNIAVFHGDPSNVTVFGESAGSLSTCIHLLSPGSQGLGKRYIMESMACVGDGEPIYKQSQAYALGQELVSSVCSGGDGGAADSGSIEAGANDAGTDVLTCLRSASASTLLSWLPPAGAAAATPSAALLGSTLGPPFSPTVEGTGGVLPDTPANLVAQGAFNTSASVLAGTNLNEWGFFVYLAQLVGSSQLAVTTAAQLDQTIQAGYGSNAAAVEAQYQPVTDANASQVFVNIVTDDAFRCPARRLAQALQAKGLSDYYLYSYEIGKAWHEFELVSLFGGTQLAAFGATTPSVAYTQTMLAYWTQFAATGSPSRPDGGAPVWPTNAVAGSDQYMQLVDPTPGVMTGLGKTNCEFWAQLPAPM